MATSAHPLHVRMAFQRQRHAKPCFSHSMHSGPAARAQAHPLKGLPDQWRLYEIVHA